MVDIDEHEDDLDYAHGDEGCSRAISPDSSCSPSSAHEHQDDVDDVQLTG